ncbi:MAG: asparagine synthase (glutamine-hydrolyzing) [Blastocatellia bacterium]|nr:asparagine synthase (glutamine-hydrolyzing) [Blastocatellia bacterium]
MCGICGIFKHSNTQFEISESLIRSMRDRMLHRGPDDAGTYISPDGRVGFGHRRLSIVDLSASGRQPMANEDGSIWISFNGEIYNHKRLRAELLSKGHIYKSNTDTETILHLYEEHGLDFVQAIEGMFAIALWDSNQERLILVRDRLGIKPLYYTEVQGQLLFASEIKSLLAHPQVIRDVDEESLYHYLTFLTTPAPRTLFRGIKKLPAGHILVCDLHGRISIRNYWDAIVARPQEDYSEEFCIDRIQTLLAESVEKQMMSDVPFGVFLSGGVDSSANVALMARAMNKPVRTFTVGFNSADGYNELEYARQIAHHFGTDHHEVMIGPEDVVDFLPDLIFHQDEPIADPVCVPLYYVSKLVRDSGTIVVQVGEGSDEIFSGYSNYIDYLNLYEKVWKNVEHMPMFARKIAGFITAPFADTIAEHFLPRGKKLFPELVRRMGSGEELFWGGVIIYDEVSKRDLLSKSYRDRTRSLSSYTVAKAHIDKIRAEKPSADFLERLIYVELKMRLAELLLMRVDKITMATSIEARVPFLDHKLVEFAMNIPRKLKYKDGQAKYILKKALEGVLPDNIIYRKKQGFGLPIKEWFIDRMSKFVQDSLMRSPLRKRELFNYDYIKTLIDVHRSGKIDYSFNLWSLLNLSLWYEHWIEDRLVAIEPTTPHMRTEQ